MPLHDARVMLLCMLTACTYKPSSLVGCLTYAHATCAGTVAIVSAGTSDELVAEECRATADIMGCYCFRLADVSVDGLHRILQNMSGLPPVHACGSQQRS